MCMYFVYLFQFSDNAVYMGDPTASVFKYIQALLTQSSGTGKPDKYRRIWEPTYTYVFDLHVNIMSLIKGTDK